MAVKFKCTKINNRGVPGPSSGTILFTVDFVDPTTAPPTPGSITIGIVPTHTYPQSSLINDIDAEMTTIMGDEMDWTL